MINDWENPQIQGRNREPARASLIPYTTVKEALRGLKIRSAFYHLLNGAWRFFFAPNPDSAPRDFQLPEFSVAAWDSIQVPGNWQLQGYDIPYYTDVQLLFPPDDVPRMVMDRHWGRAYNHLYRNHGLLALGVDVDTAVEFTATGAQVWGGNTVVVFDGRFASYAVGTNGALSERYVLLDTYVEGDAILP